MVSYKYDEWGKLLNIDALDTYHPVAKYNPYIYKTYYYDYESKMYYLNSRYYHPSLRRFLTVDNIFNLKFDKIGRINLYDYCYNNSIMLMDSSENVPSSNSEFNGFYVAVLEFGIAFGVTLKALGFNEALKETNWALKQIPILNELSSLKKVSKHLKKLVKG